ncbi:hypothetical protein KP509_16G023900 [Ceratopteris richardii]|nr:hypothetical protein KP509_16G023900 [Ceratopteris richardii]
MSNVGDPALATKFDSDGSISPLRSEMIIELQRDVEEMWPALKNAVNVIAQHCPEFMRGSQMLHGDGGPGSIRLVNFGPASGLVTYAKEEILELDDDKMILTYLLLEGDLRKDFKLFKPSISLKRVNVESEPVAANKSAETVQAKCLATWVLEYEFKEGITPPNIELINEGAKIFFRLLESSVEAQQSASSQAGAAMHQPLTNQPSTPLAV